MHESCATGHIFQVLAVFRSFPFRTPAAPGGNGSGGGSLVEETQAPPPAYNTLAREPEEAGEVIAEQADPENVGENGSVQPAVSTIAVFLAVCCLHAAGVLVQCCVIFAVALCGFLSAVVPLPSISLYSPFCCALVLFGVSHTTAQIVLFLCVHRRVLQWGVFRSYTIFFPATITTPRYHTGTPLGLGNLFTDTRCPVRTLGVRQP